jgi:hypothetical protein
MMLAASAPALRPFTCNLRHFPPAALRQFCVEAQHPDEFPVSLLDLDVATVRKPSWS